MSDHQPEEDPVVDGAIVANKITTDMVTMSGDTPQPGDRVRCRELYGEDCRPRDAAVEKAAERVMATLRGAGLEPDMSTLKITDHYDEIFLRDTVTVEVIAK